MLLERGGLSGDVACGLRERVADFLLPVRGVRARLLPFGAELRGHRCERIGPRGQAQLVARRQILLQIRMRLAHRAQQRGRVLLERRGGRVERLPVALGQRLVGPLLTRQRVVPRRGHAARRRVEARRDAVEQARRALLERFDEAVRRAVQALRERVARALMFVERVAPDVRDVRRCRVEAGRQPVELPLHSLRDGVVQRGRLACERRHRGFHDGLQRRAGHARALGGAVLQRLPDRRREARIRLFRLAEKRLLAGDLPLGRRNALLLERRHHRLQPIDQRGHHVGLPLQQPEGLVALMGVRVHAQRRRDLRVERLRGLEPLAPAKRGQEAQHRGRGHAGDRGAERESEPLDGRGERRADRMQVRRALERGAGAPERHDHAEERAQHAEQHEQADQIRRQRGARQRDALAFDAQAHRVAQARMQPFEPRPQFGRRLGQVRDRVRERGRGLLIAAQFERAGKIAGGDHDGHGERERIRRGIARADPADRGETGEKENEMNVMSGHGGPVSWREGRRAALRPVENELPAR
ncbi:hypothetical protein X946_3487 [Burkholderia sp. ABCPW 111]|nr:hypothetical protein X946_3487 [Burkholderia sp. ABCPW 111]